MLRLVENLIDFSVVFASMSAATAMLLRVFISAMLTGI